MRHSRSIGLVSVRPKVIKGRKTGKWLVDIPASLTGNGKRVRKLFDNRRRAEEVARELRRRIDPVTGHLVTLCKKSGLSFRQAAEAWYEDERLRVESLKKRASTFKEDGYRLRVICRDLGDEDVKSITARRIAQYQAERIKAGRHPMTVNREMGTLRLVLAWAKKDGFIDMLPEIEHIPVLPPKCIVPTPEEVVRIIEALPQRLKAPVRFLAETGCRVSEALNLTWPQVDEVGGIVEIRAREGWTPKTQQSERVIPLNPDLLAMIRSLPKDGILVFPGQEVGRPIGNMRKAFASAVATADIRRRGQRVKLTPKVLRKAHATWQAERGTSESVLQGLLGHAKGSKVTKQFYVHTTEEAKRAAVMTLPVAGN